MHIVEDCQASGTAVVLHSEDYNMLGSVLGSPMQTTM